MANLKPLETKNLPAKFAWERPERKDQAGSLVIFGGVSLKLKEVDTAFKAARSFGLGSVYALVPESLAKVFKREDPYLIPVNFDGYYGLTDSGLKTFLEEFSLADSLILADIGKSSATEHKLALQISKSFKPVAITDSAIGLAISYHAELLENPNLSLILNLQNLQKLIKASGIKLSSAILSTQTLGAKLELLSQFQSQIKSRVILVDEGRVVSLSGNEYLNLEQSKEPLEIAAQLMAWQVWDPKSNFLEKLFAANSNL